MPTINQMNAIESVIENINFMSIIYYINMIRKFVYLCYIFTSEFIRYKVKNCILCYKNNVEEERFNSLKKVVNKLEEMNIVYVKIFQSLCLNKDLLSIEEKEYLIKYTDNVPYVSSEIDYDILDKLDKEYNIQLDTNEPINSGVVSIVFKGIYGNKKVVIKILKKNIREKLEEVFSQIQLLSRITYYIPYLNKLNMNKLLIDNKELLLNQIDFLIECYNILEFKNKNKNIKEFVIPDVYESITNKYNNVIVMENIKGLTFEKIETFDDTIKHEFSKLLLKFGFVSIFHNNAIHCDLHSGNIFFYINNDKTYPKYQIGIIDFGIVTFPSKENQKQYYEFLYDIKYKKNFDNIEKIISVIIEEKNKYENMNKYEKANFINEIKELINNNIIDYRFKSYVNLFNIISRYNFSFTKEFNQICLSLQMASGLCYNLCIEYQKTEQEVIEEFNYMNSVIEI